MQGNWRVLVSTKMSLWAATFLALGACSSVEDVDSLEQPFGWSSCGTATANATFSGGLPLLGAGGGGGAPPAAYLHISPSSYNTCFRGYVVDVNDLTNSHTGPTSDGSPAQFRVSWGAASGVGGGSGDGLDTQTACENAWGSAIFYKKVGSAWSAQGAALEANGTWTSGHCTPPSISSQSVLTLAAGDSYRIAGTMRTVRGGSILHPIKFSQNP
jgi:hypothetical protein